LIENWLKVVRSS